MRRRNLPVSTRGEDKTVADGSGKADATVSIEVLAVSPGEVDDLVHELRIAGFDVQVIDRGRGGITRRVDDGAQRLSSVGPDGQVLPGPHLGAWCRERGTFAAVDGTICGRVAHVLDSRLLLPMSARETIGR